MKKRIPFLLLLLFSCNKEKNTAETFPVSALDNHAWTVYEGRVPLNERRNLFIEVSMLPTDFVGEGYFQLKEYLEEENGYTQVSDFTGKYSSLYGEGPEELMVQFHNSAQVNGLTRTYLSNTGFKNQFSNADIRMIREELFRNTDLALKTQGKNKLIVLDQKLKPLTLDPQYNLIKRTSKLFTLEGYFRHNGDTAEFFEMNTRERWAVSKLGEYLQASSQYHKLVKDKFEVTYLKATGYSICHTNKEGKEIEALVLKKIIQMTSSPTITQEYNHLVN